MFTLSAITPATSAAFVAVRKAVTAVSQRAGSALRVLRHRREIQRLAELDDHQLKDIGLSRTDVGGALAVSLLDDPSHVLCDIAGASHSQVARAASLGVRRALVIKAIPKEV